MFYQIKATSKPINNSRNHNMTINQDLLNCYVEGKEADLAKKLKAASFTACPKYSIKSYKIHQAQKKENKNINKQIID